MREKADYIYVQTEEDLWEKVRLEDIFYIETVKSTHYCQVRFKDGTGKIRADITPLYEEFSSHLFRSKASTLVNLDMVQKIDVKNRILYFGQNIYCSYAQRVSGEIKQKLKIRNYRSNRGENHEQTSDVSI